MVEINAAWALLRDPVQRSWYDRERAQIAAVAGPPPASSFAPAGPARQTPPLRGTAAAAVVGMGTAGPPPGRPSGTVLNFGRYSGWSLGEIGRMDPGYLEWLDRMPIGRPHRAELDALLRRIGLRLGEPAAATQRRGLFRRR